MHDILEGVLPYETKLMLQKFIQVDQYLQLDDLNHMKEDFKLGYTESANWPTAIAFATLTSGDNSLKQNGRYNPLNILWLPISAHNTLFCDCLYKLIIHVYVYITATQMWLLARHLPLMIGAEIPIDDEHTLPGLVKY